MNKYTVIYAEQVGYNRGQTVTHYKHLECNKEELYDKIEELCSWGNVWFVFYGHCQPLTD